MYTRVCTCMCNRRVGIAFVFGSLCHGTFGYTYIFSFFFFLPPPVHWFMVQSSHIWPSGILGTMSTDRGRSLLFWHQDQEMQKSFGFSLFYAEVKGFLFSFWPVLWCISLSILPCWRDTDSKQLDSQVSRKCHSSRWRLRKHSWVRECLFCNRHTRVGRHWEWDTYTERDQIQTL